MSMNRRDFIRTTGLGVAAIAASPGYASTSRFGDRTGRIVPPDQKLNIACVGCGGMGEGDVRAVGGENIVALCDVDTARAGRVFRRYQDIKKYKDFRQMLIEMDDEIDAVTVSTPDHMHFPVAMMAIQMGKHVFVQKPMAHTILEARQLMLAARKYKVATHMGIQGHAGNGIRRMEEWIEADAIGPVRELRIWTNRPIWPQGIDRPKEVQSVPPTLDWNRWLGVAPERPYNRCYLPFNWRGWWDFGCGALGDIGCHALDSAFHVLKLGAPTSVEAKTSPVNDETAPKWSIITYQFPARHRMPPLKLVWSDGNKKPPRPEELESGRRIPGGIGGQLWTGDKGTIMVSDVYCRSARIIPEAKMQDFIRNRRPKERIAPSIGHHKEWIQACKGGKPAGANFDYSGPLTEMVLLGNLSVRTGKKIEWDGENMRCTNVPEANKYVRKKYRVF